MDKEYRQLLERSIKSTEMNANAINILAETSKRMNDTLTSHNVNFLEMCGKVKEGNDISKANNVILIKYLKWAIILLVIALGGAKLFEEAKLIITNYVL